MPPAELDATVSDLHTQREGVVKVRFAESGPTQTSNALAGVDEAEKRFIAAGAIEPPYNPATLAGLLEHSNALRQNVDSYRTNIDGFGHKFTPIIDFDAPDAAEKVRMSIAAEREQTAVETPTVLTAPATPTDSEVGQRMQQMRDEAQREKAMLEFFFDNCTEDMSFVALRRKLRLDIEVTGNGYVEVLRNGGGQVAQFVYVPAFTMRLTPTDQQHVPVKVRQRVTPITFQDVPRKKLFRKYVQVFEARVIFFKEFGDPRVMSSTTGKVYDTAEQMLADDSKAVAATEIIHFKIDSPRTPYGVPRWIGTLLCVLGSRQSEEVNYLYFDNKSVPPLALLVSGGTVGKDTEKRLADYIQTEIKGKKNYHKILIIEATGSGGSMERPGQTKVELKPLTDAQNKDALFQNYDERNIDKIGTSFRLPRLLRGDIRDFNRATAEAALKFAEQQVFAPERGEFDFTINRRILTDLGVRYWKFESLTPSVKDSDTLSDIIAKLMDAGSLTVNDSRELLTDVFNRPFPRIEEDWADMPVRIGLQSMRASMGDTTSYDIANSATEKDAVAAPPAITRTALGSVITVNEARRAHGLSEWDTDDGKLTISAYAEKMRASAGLVKEDSGGDYGGALAGPPPTGPADGTLHVTDLRSAAGAMGPGAARAGGARRLRRLPPPGAAKRVAGALLALRDELKAAEDQEAEHQFLMAKRETDGALPDDVVRRLVPVELLGGE